MKHSATAALALALCAGLAGAAGAQSMATPGPTPNSWQNALPGPAPIIANESVREAQQQLQALGLYRGPIDGRMDRNTRMAIAAFQQRNGLPRTETLDRTTLAWLVNSTATGYGSSTPPAANAPLSSPGNPQATLGAGGITTGGHYMAR